MDKVLLDKLPLCGGSEICIEEHWTQDERDKIIEDIVTLGAELRHRTKRTFLYHENDNLKMVRGEIAHALLRLLEVLRPIYGDNALWPLEQALNTFNEAHKGNRHWLVTFNKDKPHLPQRAPYREVRKALAAAVLEYFDKFQVDLAMTQSKIAARIAKAMTKGGFKVRPERKESLSGRTVQDWRILYAAGKRPERTKRKAYIIQSFDHFVKLLEDGRGDKEVPQYFIEALGDVTSSCQHHHELFVRDRAVIARKS